MVRKFHVGGTVPIAPKSRTNAPQDSTMYDAIASRLTMFSPCCFSNPRFHSRPSSYAAQVCTSHIFFSFDRELTQETPQSQPVSEPAAEPAAEPGRTLVTRAETAVALSNRTETRYRDEKATIADDIASSLIDDAVC